MNPTKPFTRVVKSRLGVAIGLSTTPLCRWKPHALHKEHVFSTESAILISSGVVGRTSLILLNRTATWSHPFAFQAGAFCFTDRPKLGKRVHRIEEGTHVLVVHNKRILLISPRRRHRRQPTDGTNDLQRHSTVYCGTLPSFLH